MHVIKGLVSTTIINQLNYYFMKKLELKQMENLEGGKSCNDDAIGYLIGATVAGTIAGGPVGFMVGATVGLIGSMFVATSRKC